MSSPFRSSIRRKSAQQLLNMISGDIKWTNDQLKDLLEEIENRGIESDEVHALRAQLGGASEEDILESEDSDFQNDLSIIYDSESKEGRKNFHRQLALIGGGVVSVLLLMVLVALGIMTEVQDDYLTSLMYAFFDFAIYFSVGFLAIWAFFVARLYLVSFVIACVFFVLLMLATFVEHSTVG